MNESNRRVKSRSRIKEEPPIQNYECCGDAFKGTMLAKRVASHAEAATARQERHKTADG